MKLLMTPNVQKQVRAAAPAALDWPKLWIQ